MSIRLLEQVLTRWGGSATVFLQDGDPEGIPVRAFVQPVLSRYRKDQEEIHSPLGRVDPNRWLYLGGLEADLRQVGTGTVLWQGRHFEVERAELILVGEEPSHYWGLLRPGKEEP